MGHDFSGAVSDALRAVGYQGERDNVRFRAALLDLSRAYPDESSFISSAADDSFLLICSKVMREDSPPSDIIKTKASEYLQSGKYHTGKEYADRMADYVVRGFLLYCNKAEAPRVTRNRPPAGRIPPRPVPPRSPDSGPRPRNAGMPPQDFGPPVVDVHHRNVMRRPPQPKKPASRKKLLAIVCAACIALIGGAIGGFAYYQHQLKTYQIQSKLPVITAGSSIDIGEGGSRTLEVDNVHEGDAVTWDSSDYDCVSVDEDGTIHAEALGSATISANVENYDEVLTCEVNVNELEICAASTGSDISFTEGVEEVLYVDGTDTKDIEWSTSELDIFAVNPDEDGTATVTCEECGFAEITAEVDGQELSIDPETYLPEADMLRVSEESVTVTDETRIYISFNGSSESNDNIWCTTDNVDVADVNWTQEWYGDNQYVDIVKYGSGSTTLTFWAGDEAGNRDYSIEAQTVQVTCE